MSITREEAILELETMLAKYAFDVDEAQAIGVAFAALRPVSREQVEKVWRGEWLHGPAKDQAAVAALRAYAAATDNAELAADIINWVGAEPNDPLTLEQAKRELEAATADLEEIMFKGGHNIDTCHFCTNSQCYGRGGTQTCNPKWRGQKED